MRSQPLGNCLARLRGLPSGTLGGFEAILKSGGSRSFTCLCAKGATATWMAGVPVCCAALLRPPGCFAAAPCPPHCHATPAGLSLCNGCTPWAPGARGSTAVAAAYGSSSHLRELRARRLRRHQRAAAAAASVQQSSGVPPRPAAAWGPKAAAPALGRVSAPFAARRALGPGGSGGAALEDARSGVFWLQELLKEVRGSQGPAAAGSPCSSGPLAPAADGEHASLSPSSRAAAAAALPEALSGALSPAEERAPGPFCLEALAADCSPARFLAYSHAARHGVPTALDVGPTRARGRAPRAALLTRERALRALLEAIGSSSSDGDGSAAALMEASQAQLEAAAAAAGVGVGDVEGAVYDYFVFRR
jgi:hypothetical protein